MLTENACPRCGARRPSDAPGGLCPRCLLRLGFDTDLLAGPADDAEPPRPGVLTALHESIGPVPRVLLRDGPDDGPRPVRTRSEEMPGPDGQPGHYHLFGEIARGGMGVILKGRDVDLGRDLAVKVLLEKHRDQPEMVRRFVEEAQIGGQLQHPGIVPVYELGRFPDRRLYIAMKLVGGRTLAASLEARKDPAEDRPRFLAVFAQVCQTMAYAHARGVIHRDLKPSNVMEGRFGEVQVMDWGLAKVLDQGGVADEEKAWRSRDDPSGIRTLRAGALSGPDAGDSRAGSVLGTPAYMAPEQARGDLDLVDERADVFGLGSILCEILTGDPAYTGATGADLYRMAERADLRDALARLGACDADGEVVALARSCLAVAAKDRPRDAGAVAAGLTAYLAGVQRRLHEAEVAQAAAEARAVGERKRRLLAVGLAAAVLAIAALGGGGWAWMARDRATRAETTTREVNKALDEAALLRGQARSRPGDPGGWAEAVAAARRAEALLARGEGGNDLRSRVKALLNAILRDRKKAEVAEKDRRMVERLAEIHRDYTPGSDRARMDAEYTAAFRDYGIDLDALDPAAAGARIAARPVAVELASALDQCIFNRHMLHPPDRAGASRLLAVAKVADPDPWRIRLRDALDLATTDGEEARETLEELAAAADVSHLPGEAVSRLACALADLHDNETAISLLRRAQRAHPDDFWINLDLGLRLGQMGRLDEAIRFYSVAVALRPRSDFPLNLLGDALRDAGRLEEADAVRREALLRNPEGAGRRRPPPPRRGASGPAPR